MQTYLKDLKWGKFNLIKGDMISDIAAHYGEWSEVEVQVFRCLLQVDSNVIEVGSNIGMHAVPIAKKVHRGKVICFEPQRIIFQQLCCNLSLNNITNVESYRLGVGEHNETIEIESSDYTNAWNYGSFSLDKGFSTEGNFSGTISHEILDIIKLDDFLAVQKLNSLSLLKIDAEGFDIRVLNGAAKTIQRFRPAIFIEAHPHSSQPIFEHLNALNYRIFWVVSERYQQKNFYQAERFEQGYDINFLALPNEIVDTIQTDRQELFSLISILTEIKSISDLNKKIPLLFLT